MRYISMHGSGKVGVEKTKGMELGVWGKGRKKKE